MDYEWKIVKVGCPNCLKLVIGYEGKDGITKMKCQNCGTVLVNKIMGRRHQQLDIYASKFKKCI